MVWVLQIWLSKLTFPDRRLHVMYAFAVRVEYIHCAVGKIAGSTIGIGVVPIRLNVRIRMMRAIFNCYYFHFMNVS